MLGVALATYVTKSSLRGNCGAQFGFNSSAGGTGNKTYNVGSNGHLLGPGFADNQSYTIFQLLKGANAAKAAGTFNANAWNVVFSGINESGDIKLTRGVRERALDRQYEGGQAIRLGPFSFLGADSEAL